jgi:predicted flap endonuclease-1-like 5' DNA nuclease
VLTIAVLVLIALAAAAGYALGVRRRTALPPQPSLPPPPLRTVPPAAEPAMPAAVVAVEQARTDQERARIIRSISAEAFALRGGCDQRVQTPGDADHAASAASAPAALAAELAAARAESARYRQLVIDIENSAPPPILMGSAEPDDLKLIVGIGPVLERMLHHLGIGTFRQIARWTPREIAEFDSRLPEFPGRIVRDQWVTQARALHASKYGESPLGR